MGYPKIIGISGKINSGKDAVGNMIRYITDDRRFDMYTPGEYIDSIERNVLRSHSDYRIKKFADVLKLTTAAILGVDIHMMEDREYKATKLGPDWTNYGFRHRTNGFFKTYGTEEERDKGYNYQKQNPTFTDVEWEKYEIELTPRRILQLLGTEAGKEVIHPNIWVNASFADYLPGSQWIFTDVRFPNEVEAIENRGGIVINVLRDHVPYCKTATDVFITLQSLYAKSDVVSGEFINKVTFNAMTSPQRIQEGIDSFLAWDESDEHFIYEVPHLSETALDSHSFKHTINNGWSYDELLFSVSEILDRTKELQK